MKTGSKPKAEREKKYSEKAEFKMEMKRLTWYMEQEMMESQYENQSLRDEAVTTLRQNSHFETATKELQSEVEYLKDDWNTTNVYLEQFKELRNKQHQYE